MGAKLPNFNGWIEAILGDVCNTLDPSHALLRLFVACPASFPNLRTSGCPEVGWRPGFQCVNLAQSGLFVRPDLGQTFIDSHRTLEGLVTPALAPQTGYPDRTAVDQHTLE